MRTFRLMHEQMFEFSDSNFNGASQVQVFLLNLSKYLNHQD